MYRSLGLYGDVIIQDETENTSVGAAISIYLGANKNLTVEEVTGKLRSDPEKPFLVGFQLENDPEMVADCIKACREMGIDTLLDPAPAAPLHGWVYPYLPILNPMSMRRPRSAEFPNAGIEDAFSAGR